MNIRSAPKDFVFDLERVEAHLEPVFEPLIWTKNPVVTKINQDLASIGSYARLYYYLRNVYCKSMPKNTFSAEPNIRLIIYETEITRREISKELSGSSPIRPPEAKPSEMTKAAKLCEIACAFVHLLATLPAYYEPVRKTCLYSTNLSRVARTDRIYRIYDAEIAHFGNDPKRKAHIEETIREALRNIFIDPPIN